MSIRLKVCMCITCMFGTCGSQKEPPGLLQLALQVVVSSPVWVIGTKTLVPCKTASTHNRGAFSPAPQVSLQQIK